MIADLDGAEHDVLLLKRSTRSKGYRFCYFILTTADLCLRCSGVSMNEDPWVGLWMQAVNVTDIIC